MAQRLPAAMRKMPKREKLIAPIPTWNIFRGDLVEVISGPHRGKQGEVKEVIRAKNAVVLNDINMRHRYVKAKPGVAPGRIYLAPGPIHYSNVNLVDPSIGKPTRIGIRFAEDGERLRISKKTGTVIPKPDVLKERQAPRRTETGPLDTAPEDVLERTVEDWEVKRL
ncbi:ribosomal protein L24 [Aphanomyces invadans]|uniref:Large ribosomal subunit protein uL24c n=1 Tax=Aphanomyces invadans TaxID=157072 RepID=A0A024TRM1_9STRA|nr:ribosomal protein L24 [Aphanomyces invadans]ETV96654.1 ribosomal protein L24 [Aphanomyces invadans]|eukprot:XP_008874917.1 ribosomal protein L24 [Aphanomyces invadans]